MKEETTERAVLIPLSSAHVTQYTKDGEKTDWGVLENKTENPLFELPGHLSEGDVFTVLEFARKYELNAFNVGMKHMNKEMTSRHNVEKEKLLRVIKELKAANNRLADKLGSFIGEEV